MAKRKEGDLTIQLTPRGAVAAANLLFERGYIDDDTRSRITWFYESGIGWENKQFRKAWQIVRRAAGRALNDMTGKKRIRPALKTVH